MLAVIDLDALIPLARRPRARLGGPCRDWPDAEDDAHQGDPHCCLKGSPLHLIPPFRVLAIPVLRRSYPSVARLGSGVHPPGSAAILAASGSGLEARAPGG